MVLERDPDFAGCSASDSSERPELRRRRGRRPRPGRRSSPTAGSARPTTSSPACPSPRSPGSSSEASSGSSGRCSSPRARSTRSPSCPGSTGGSTASISRTSGSSSSPATCPRPAPTSAGASNRLLSPDERNPSHSPSEIAPRPRHRPRLSSPSPSRGPPRCAAWSMPGSICTPGSARRRSRTRSGRDQERVLRSLVRKARRPGSAATTGSTAIRSVADFQAAVPLRTYEDLWDDYLRDRYPVFENLTWPGRIPFLALTSGTTQGATKYIPVSREMVASNRKAAQTMVAYHWPPGPTRGCSTAGSSSWAARPISRQPAPGVARGTSAGSPPLELHAAASALHVSSAGAGPRVELGPQARAAGRAEPRRADHPGQRRAELAARALPARARPDAASRRSPRSGPTSSWSSTAASSSTPTARPSAIARRLGGSPAPGDLSLLRGLHRLRRPGDRAPAADLRPRPLLRVRAGRRARTRLADAALAGNVRDRRELRDRRLDLRGHVGARDRRHRPVRVARPAACSRSPAGPGTRSRRSAST